ncbi:MAG: hypothetical protein C0597_04785 [Marinilabiliales bacterium]|nr:MAG: hypothetical protein C0597_04785 [Marinilabiliales bacterium]
MKNKSLGFNSDNILVIQRPNRLRTNVQAFKDIINKNPDIISSTYSYGAPQMLVETMVYYTKENNVEESYSVARFPTDFDFIDTYGLNLVKGRKLDKEFSTDSAAVVVNETALRVMGLNNPLEQEIYYSYEKDLPLKIVGVVEDFHTGPLQSPIRPTLVIINRDRPPMYYMIKYKAGKTKETIEFVKEKWNEFLPGEVLDYNILNDHIKTQYKSEDQAGKLILVFALLSILIASLGLFGMASYIANSKVKEVGIRKVLGATINGIFRVMIKEFFKWVLLANVIAWPIGYFVMNNWLQNYAFKINLRIHIFIMAGIISFVITFITVAYKVLKLSMINPTKCLRYE